jgi:hypothetical protein
MNRKFYSLKKTSWLIFVFVCLSYSKLHAQVYANSQVNGVTGLCLICGVSNPNNPVNNSNVNDYSTFNITAGLLGTTVYQTLLFPAVSTTGCDSLIIGIGSGDALLSVNLFAGITVQTFNGTTANNDVQQITASNLSLLQNNTRAEVRLKPANTFDRVKITLSSSLVGLLNGFRLYYAYHTPGTPTPVVTDSTAICAGDSATLSATGASGATIRWYNAAGGGSLLFTGNNYRVSPAATTTYYAEATLNGCNSLRKPVKVTVNPRPANPVYSVPQGFVCGNATLPVTNHTNGINYRVAVHYVPFDGLPGDTSYLVINNDTITVPQRLPVIGSSIMVNVYVQAINPLTGCTSDTISNLFIQGASARIPTVNADSITICKGDTATFIASNPILNLVEFSWYDAPTGGNLLFTGATFKTSPSVTTSYYVEAKFNCVFPVRKAVKVIVTKLPAPVYTVPAGVHCGNATIVISNFQAGLNYNVRLRNNFNSTVLRDTSFLVTNSGSIQLPNFIYFVSTTATVYVQAVNPVTGCRSDSVSMVYIQGGSAGLPVIDADSLILCQGSDTTLHAFVPGFATARIYWYDAPAGGTRLFTGNFFTVSPTATTTYYVTAGAQCEIQQRLPVIVTVVSCFTRTDKDITQKYPQYPTSAGNAIAFKVYPNPSRGTIILGNNAELTGSRFDIFDSNGKLVQNGTINGNTLIMRQGLPEGLYIIRLVTTGKKLLITRVVLLK